MNTRNWHLSGLLAAVTFALVAVHSTGCSKSNDIGKTVPEQAAEVVAPPVEKLPDPEADWSGLVEKATAHLEADELEEAQQCLAACAKVYEAPLLPSEEQQTKLAELTTRLADKREVLAMKRRDENLVDAEKLMDLGKFTEAVQKLNEVKALAPTDQQRTRASAIADQIESMRKARRDLQLWIQMLGTDRRKDVAAAQANLLKKPEIALGMLLEASENIENPILAANALEALRLLNRPDITAPAMLAVLRRTEQQQVWPAAIRELVRMQRPGAGEPLLELALSTELPEQRAAALTALSQVIDPPKQTLVAMLPLLQQDGPVLAAALRATYHAVSKHEQYDLQARRGLDVALTAEQEQQLSQRLVKLIELPADNEDTAEVIQAAKVLAYATRQLTPQPLANVQVRYAEAQEDDGPASAVLDGVWNSVDLNTMWRHPVAKSSTIVLDLGQAQTVMGVRIWNFNQVSGTQRGWKDVEIFVSDSPTEADPIARGIVPPAPGAADTPDYSTLVPVPFARGRYVRLQAKKLWTSDTYTGVSEIQILGF
ncbi:MAG: discoidin domain-containing protein [Planctomycetota bacterium]|nr:discoidin domain-containing protein [Planctomycetota bacterium]